MENFSEKEASTFGHQAPTNASHSGESRGVEEYATSERPTFREHPPYSSMQNEMDTFYQANPTDPVVSGREYSFAEEQQGNSALSYQQSSNLSMSNSHVSHYHEMNNGNNPFHGNEKANDYDSHNFQANKNTGNYHSSNTGSSFSSASGQGVYTDPRIGSTSSESFVFHPVNDTKPDQRMNAATNNNYYQNDDRVVNSSHQQPNATSTFAFASAPVYSTPSGPPDFMIQQPHSDSTHMSHSSNGGHRPIQPNHYNVIERNNSNGTGYPPVARSINNTPINNIPSMDRDDHAHSMNPVQEQRYHSANYSNNSHPRYAGSGHFYPDVGVPNPQMAMGPSSRGETGNFGDTANNGASAGSYNNMMRMVCCGLGDGSSDNRYNDDNNNYNYNFSNNNNYNNSTNPNSPYNYDRSGKNSSHPNYNQNYNNQYQHPYNVSNDISYNKNQNVNYASGPSNAQGRAINKMLLEILRDRVVDPQRLDLAIQTYMDRMDCVNLATLLFHTGKKRLLLMPHYLKGIADRLLFLKEELRAREASNAFYGLKCMSSEVPEVRELVSALAIKLSETSSDFVAQAVGNALYGLQMMNAESEEIRFMLTVLAHKVNQCTEHLEAQNIGNALYGLRNMSSDYPEVRSVIAALAPKIATAREDLNGQALGNSLYGLQSMSSREPEVRSLLSVLATKTSRAWEDLKAQEVGNALYGMKRMHSDVPEVCALISALIPRIASSPDILDAQAIGNALYGLQNMRSEPPEIRALLGALAQKIHFSCPELDGQAMGNSLYGLQGMTTEHAEVREIVRVVTEKLMSSCLAMNAQELGNALYGLQRMTSEHPDVRKLLMALAQKIGMSKHELTSQEIGNALFGLQGMRSDNVETRNLVGQLTLKIQQAQSIALDPQATTSCFVGMQRMSNESEDVRSLLRALLAKFEQSWKSFSAPQIATCLYGLQRMSSADVEVKSVLIGLTKKLESCRETLSATDIGHAVFGMQNMCSEHVEVQTLLSGLYDLMKESVEPWTLSILAQVLYGMQGMSSDAPVVAVLLSFVAGKISHLQALESSVHDCHHLANCYFGLQRMSTENSDVCAILECLAARLSNISAGANGASAEVCASIMYGLQGCDCQLNVVKYTMEWLANSLQRVTSTYMTLPRSFQDMHAPSVESSRDTAAADCLKDILSCYQATTLTLFKIRHLETNPDLHARMYAELSALRSIVDIHHSEVSLPGLTEPENQLMGEVTDVLAQEPFLLTTRVLLHGFEMTSCIQLAPGIQLKTTTGRIWSPVVNLEVKGTSYQFPAKDWFCRLRKEYLEREHGVVVTTVPVEVLHADSNRLGSKLNSSILAPLYPPSLEDMNGFRNQILAIQASSTTDVRGLAHLNAELLFRFQASARSLVGSSSNSQLGLSPKSLGSSTGSVGAVGLLNQQKSTSTYVDDDYLCAAPLHTHSQDTKHFYTTRDARFPLGFGWLGNGVFRLSSTNTTTTNTNTNAVTNSSSSVNSAFPDSQSAHGSLKLSRSYSTSPFASFYNTKGVESDRLPEAPHPLVGSQQIGSQQAELRISAGIIDSVDAKRRNDDGVTGLQSLLKGSNEVNSYSFLELGHRTAGITQEYLDDEEASSYTSGSGPAAMDERVRPAGHLNALPRNPHTSPVELTPRSFVASSISMDKQQQESNVSSLSMSSASTGAILRKSSSITPDNSNPTTPHPMPAPPPSPHMQLQLQQQQPEKLANRPNRPPAIVLQPRPEVFPGGSVVTPNEHTRQQQLAERDSMVGAGTGTGLAGVGVGASSSKHVGGHTVTVLDQVHEEDGLHSDSSSTNNSLRKEKLPPLATPTTPTTPATTVKTTNLSAVDRRSSAKQALEESDEEEGQEDENEEENEADLEIAALEAQLEVARLEARLKLLKSKKAAAANAKRAKEQQLLKAPAKIPAATSILGNPLNTEISSDAMGKDDGGGVISNSSGSNTSKQSHQLMQNEGHVNHPTTTSNTNSLASSRRNSEDVVGGGDFGSPSLMGDSEKTSDCW